jgi:hypothetical protein
MNEIKNKLYEKEIREKKKVEIKKLGSYEKGIF